MTLAVKRGLDAAVATAGLIALSPLLLAVALAIKIESPRLPLFFNDTVMGRDGVRFRMRKFRTMLPHPIDYDHRPEVTSGNPLVTRVGAVLRRLKLDELPQLWNVLRGDMSLVGPRPMDPARYARATEFQRQRLLMRPGLTGWAQVQYSYGASVEDAFNKLEYDLFYLKNFSLTFDLAILFRTVRIVLGGYGGR